MKSILKRLEALEEKNVAKKTPTYREFLKEWENYDELTKALWIAEAEMPGIGGKRNQYTNTICGYLERMGLVTEHYSLEEFVAEMNALGGDQ